MHVNIFYAKLCSIISEILITKMWSSITVTFWHTCRNYFLTSFSVLCHSGKALLSPAIQTMLLLITRTNTLTDISLLQTGFLPRLVPGSSGPSAAPVNGKSGVRLVYIEPDSTTRVVWKSEYFHFINLTPLPFSLIYFKICCNVISLAIFYCHFHNIFSFELGSCMPPPFPQSPCTNFYSISSLCSNFSNQNLTSISCYPFTCSF